jgi:hypothetical protein
VFRFQSAPINAAVISLTLDREDILKKKKTVIGYSGTVSSFGRHVIHFRLMVEMFLEPAGTWMNKAR